jgi:hypothetical protein
VIEVSINGGNITATGSDSAGIGSGHGFSNGTSNVATVIISGGILNAVSLSGGAGIWSG